MANRGVTFEGITDLESPGYEKGVPMGVTSDCNGHPVEVNGGITPSDEAGEPFSVI